ncbi:MAG: YARHG domain-containing protein [Cyclobacteriaceae bacterium]
MKLLFWTFFLPPNDFDAILKKAECLNIYNTKYESRLLSLDLSVKYFGDLIGNESDIYIVGKICQRKCPVVIIDRASGMGAGRSEYYAIIFSESGDRLDTQYLFAQSYEYNNEYEYSFLVLSDSLIEVKSEKKDLTKLKYFYLAEDEIKEVFPGLANPDRKFSISTEQIIPYKELKKYKQEDLDIMRNEIFADHGYIFKTEKWVKYFSKQPWYTPSFDNVDSKLSMIEKINIKTILEVSN